jgi:hypothetical protein
MSPVVLSLNGVLLKLMCDFRFDACCPVVEPFFDLRHVLALGSIWLLMHLHLLLVVLVHLVLWVLIDFSLVIELNSPSHHLIH